MDTRERAAFIRLAIIGAAWALGEALVWQLRAGGLGLVVPVLLAAAAFVATRDLARVGSGRTTAWRGRGIDRDRWN